MIEEPLGDVADVDNSLGAASVDESAILEKPRLNSTLTLWLVLAVGTAILVGLLLLRGNRASDLATKRPGVGEKLVDWRVEPLTGGDAPLTSGATAGQVTLINLWGPWCGYCRVELPHLIALKQRLADQSDFRLVSVSCGPERDDDLTPIRDSTAKYLADRKIDLSTYADPGGKFRHELSLTVGMSGYPLTVLVDRRGIIRAVWDGYVPGDEQEMERLVMKQLAAAPKST